MAWNIYHGDCREVMAKLHAESVDAVICDPPYGLGFMGKKWDDPGALVERRADASQKWDHVGGNHNPANSQDSQRTRLSEGRKFQDWATQWAAEALRVAKPGAHLLAFGGTRTYHRLACAIEDAGWEIRDCVMWVYGSGFPKSHDVSKAIDKAAGAEREVVGTYTMPADSTAPGYAASNGGGYGEGFLEHGHRSITAPATDAARQWSGWGTALKPAWEPIIVARKPLCGTVAENVLKHGTGGINVDGCRVGGEPSPSAAMRASGRVPSSCKPGEYGDTITNRITPERWQESRPGEQLGRWPANVIHDGSDEVVGLFPVTTSGSRKAGRHVVAGGQRCYGLFAEGELPEIVGDSGSAARFFYCAKASKADRDEGCEGLEARTLQAYGDFSGTPEHGPKKDVRGRNHHPTVKPTALMRYLCRLVTPPGGVVLDPFTGSGSTGKAAILEGFRFIGIEREAEYVEIAKARIGAVEAGAGPLFS